MRHTFFVKFRVTLHLYYYVFSLGTGHHSLPEEGGGVGGFLGGSLDF